MADFLSIPGSRGCALALAVLAVVGGASAQQVMAKAPVGVGVAVAQSGGSADDRGAPVELFENANLDRYLRRAEAFLQREDYAAAIQVLQDVAEGRTPIEVGEETPDPTKAAVAGAETVGGPSAPLGQAERHAVFASDGRLFRPVRRLGQQMLAKMPAAGLALYRTLYDGDADRALQEAEVEGSLRALQAVVERYYASSAAGRALALLGDRSLSEGRYRAAVQHFRELLEVYPDSHRKSLGISDLWVRFKIALALSLAGDRQGAVAATELARQHADETLRIAGELQAVRDLPERPPFVGASATKVDAEPEVAGTSWLRNDDYDLVPLWQYRFAEADPYRDPTNRPRSTSISVFDENQLSNAMPHSGRYYPGTRVRFVADAEAANPPRVAFFEHFRLRIADAASGLMLAEGDGQAVPPAARDNQPRVRIAACDYALLHAMEHDGMLLGVLGYSRKPTSSTQVLRETELVAYDRATMRRRWSSENWLDGERGLRDVTFLAAPTPFGDRLLVPTLRKGVYALDCLAAADGKPMWTTPLHGGGSEFFKAPGVQVVVEGAVAFVATNAGCLAAVDVWSGDLAWIRKYERRDPLRKAPVAPVVRERGIRIEQRAFAQVAMEGFYPSELVVRDGLVVMAPIDGDMLLCVDGAVGEPVWMFDASSRYAPFGRLRALLGVADESLFACSDTHLVCLSLRGGVVRWARELPPDADGGKAGRGRGAVVGRHVVVPGMRELLVFDLAGLEPMQRIALPSFGAGREPLAGSFFVHSQGPWLAIGYAGGVEVFSTRAALGAVAAATTDPFVRASLHRHAGDFAAGDAVLAAVLADAGATAGMRAQAARALLAATRLRAVQLAETDLAGALALLDSRRPVDGNELLLQWHLARLDCAQAAGDLARLGEEQQRLYDVMEGKR